MITAAIASERRPRYRRANPPPMRLTEDDLAIVSQVARHRFLRSTHIAQLMPHRSPKKLIERLAALYHNGFLDRPRAQLDYYATAGSAPVVYGLGNNGALQLARTDAMDRADVDWTWKNRSVGRLFIDHTLLIADVLVGVTCATQARADIGILNAPSILAKVPSATSRSSTSFKLTARIMLDGKRTDASVIPDAVFGIDLKGSGKQKHFFLEADCATMPIVRSNSTQTTFARKLATYSAGANNNLFGRHLGLDNFRVLTVTTTPERATSMLDALRQLTNGKGSNQFLFVDHAAVLASQDLLSLVWTTGKGKRITLLD